MKILDRMHLAGDPNLKRTVEQLRSLNLYDNSSWLTLLSYGYAYTGDEKAEQNLIAEVAARKPDSEQAVHLALQQWETTIRHYSLRKQAC